MLSVTGTLRMGYGSMALSCAALSFSPGRYNHVATKIPLVNRGIMSDNTNPIPDQAFQQTPQTPPAPQGQQGGVPPTGQMPPQQPFTAPTGQVPPMLQNMPGMPLLYLTGGMKFGWAALGFLMGPVAILVAWLTNAHNFPQAKSEAVKFSLIGFLVSIVGWILLVLLFGFTACAAVGATATGASYYF